MKSTLIQLIGAFVLLIVVVAAFGIWYVTIQAENVKAAELSQQIKEKSDASTRIAAAKAQLAQLAPEEQEVNQYFISTSDIVPFLGQLAYTGQHLGSVVQVASVSDTPPAAGSTYGSLNLSLKISGSFVAVMRTLGSIEYGPYNIHTTSITLDSSGQTTGQAAGANTSGPWTLTGVFTISTQDTNTASTIVAPSQIQQNATTAATTTVTATSSPTPVSQPVPATSTPTTNPSSTKQHTGTTSPTAGVASPTV